MESIFYLLGIGSVIMFLILKFDLQQNSKVNKLLKETKNVQPLFLLRAVEQKLRDLNTKLYGSMGPGANALPIGRVNIDENDRQSIALELSKLVGDYNAGKITLKIYNTKLSQLHDMVSQLNLMSFETIGYKNNTALY